MKNSQKGFIVPALLVVIVLLVIGGGVYIYENKKSETPPATTNTEVQTSSPTQPVVPQNTSTNNSQNSQSNSAIPASNTNPEINLVSSAIAPIGSTITIQGTNLDPLGGYPGIGWLTNSHIFVTIKNKNTGQAAILWEGGSQGGENPVSKKITAVLSQSLCMISEVAAGGCPSEKNMTVAPGQYALSVSVDGRGSSNIISLTVTESPAPKPVISSVISAGLNGKFYPNSQVTITGSNFPVSGKTQPIVWIGSTKITGVSGLVSATAEKIVFTSPKIAAGTYNLYVTGVVGVQTADPSNPGVVVQSNTVPINVLANITVNSINPSSASVGDSIQIYGNGFKYSSNLIHVYMKTPTVTGPESSGLLWVGYPTDDSVITFTLPSYFCTLGGDPGVPCTRQTTIIPGNYKISVSDNLNTVGPLDFTVR